MSQIVIWVLGALGGTLAGIIFAVVLYYLLCRFVFKDPLSMTTVTHLLFNRGFIVNPPSDSTLPPDVKHQANPIIKTQPISISAIKPQPVISQLNEKPMAPVPVLTKKSPSIPVIKQKPAAAPAMNKQPAPTPVSIIKEQPASIPQNKEQPAPVCSTREQPKPPQIVAEPIREIPASGTFLGDTMPTLLTEVEYNYKLASEFYGDNLMPLRTEIWDTCQQQLRTLPGKIQNKLEQIYGTIKALNQLVWFATEFHRNSPALREQYMNMLTSVARELNDLTENPSSDFVPRERKPRERMATANLVG